VHVHNLKRVPRGQAEAGSLHHGHYVCLAALVADADVVASEAPGARLFHRICRLNIHDEQKERKKKTIKKHHMTCRSLEE
jgi:hypothetical protein